MTIADKRHAELLARAIAVGSRVRFVDDLEGINGFGTVERPYLWQRIETARVRADYSGRTADVFVEALQAVAPVELP